MNDQQPGRVSRRGFLAGTIAVALAACSDSGDDSSSTSAPASSGPTTTSPSSTTTSTGATTTTSTTTSSTTSTTAASPVVSDPFTVGVASGDPLADSVILWTRLVPENPLPATDVPVEWEVATDESMENLVATGTGSAIAALGHSVHVDSDRARAGHRVPLPVPCRRFRERTGANPHVRCPGHHARAVPLRVLVVPELGAGVLHGLPRPGRAG